jgi:hypothetical protein
MTAPKKPQHQWEHALSASAIVGLGLFVVAAVSRHLAIPAFEVVLFTIAVAAAALMATHLAAGSSAIDVYMIVWGVLATSWMAYARLSTPFSGPAVLLLAMPVMLLAAVGAPLVTRHNDEARRFEAEDARNVEKRKLRAWETMLESVGCPGVKALSESETRAGRTIALRLPKSGSITLEHLQAVDKKIETAKRLRRGAVRFEMGKEHSANVWMHLSERDVLKEEVAFPAGNKPRTINKPFSVGIDENGEEMLVLFREVAALIAGIRGAGKSNLIAVLLARFCQCVDTVIFMIDMKGGRTARPWLQPWLDGKCPRPAIDWVATTREEADLMLEACMAGIDVRSRSGIGGEKITPSTGTPAILLISDDIAVIFRSGGPKRGQVKTTNTQLADKGLVITATGRSEAVDPVLVVQRATVTMTGTGDLKSQCKLRFGLGTVTESEARMLLPDNWRGARPLAHIDSPGAGVIALGANVSAPGKFYRLTPQRIYGIAEETGWNRPEPDAMTAAAMGDAYATRWERAAELLDWMRKGGDGDEPYPAVHDVVLPPDVDAVFGEMVAQIDDPEAKVHPARRRMRELIAARGILGATPDFLTKALEREGKGMARETVTRWCSADSKAGLLRHHTGGRYTMAAGSPPAEKSPEP